MYSITLGPIAVDHSLLQVLARIRQSSSSSSLLFLNRSSKSTLEKWFPYQKELESGPFSQLSSQSKGNARKLLL